MKIQNIDNVLDSFIVFFSKLKKQLKTRPEVTIDFDNLRQLQLSRAFITSLLYEEEYELPTNTAIIFNEAALQAIFYLHEEKEMETSPSKTSSEGKNKASDSKSSTKKKFKEKNAAFSKKLAKKQKKLEKSIGKEVNGVKLTSKQKELADKLEILTVKNIVNYFKTQNISLPKPKSFPLKSVGIENIVVSFDDAIIDHHLKELEKFIAKKEK